MTSVGLILAALTRVMFFFDTEDFTCDRSNDAIRDLATLMTEEGVRGEFNVVGCLARELQRLDRRDVIEALKPHAIGTQTMRHSLHPTVCELSDMPDYAAAYRNVFETESEGVEILKRTFGLDVVDYAVPPGNSWSYVSLYAFADMGMTFYGGGGFADMGPEMARKNGLVPPGLRRWGMWYCNLFQLPYCLLMSLEDLMPGVTPAPDVDRVLDEAAKRDFVGFYMHPHMAVKTDHWDAVNYRGTNLVAWGEWKQVPDRPKAETEEFYRRLRAFVRRVKADPRFVVTDTRSEKARLPKRRSITWAEIPAIRTSLLRDFGPVGEPGSWCVADVFQAAVVLLRGGSDHLPGKAYGFLDHPKGLSEPLRVRADDLRAAAVKIDLTTFLPSSIAVGDRRIGPADFLLAALEVLETDAETVEIVPRDQLGSFRHCPGLEALDLKGGWCIHAPTLNAALLEERLRLQLWTLRYEGKELP